MGPEEENCGPWARWGPCGRPSPWLWALGLGQSRACRKEREEVRKV